MTKPPAIICDLDGTISLLNGRGPFEMEKMHEDPERPGMKELLTVLSWHRQIIYMTGRGEQDRERTCAWLLEREFPCATFLGSELRLLMRALHDYRADHIIKREMAERYVLPYYEVVCVFEDRNTVVKMWRELGLLCLQPQDGDY